MWGKDELPYTINIGDSVEWKDGGGTVVDIITDYCGIKRYGVLVKNSAGYYDVDLEDIELWEPYGERMDLNYEEKVRIKLYKFIRKWDLARDDIDAMLDFIYQSDVHEEINEEELMEAIMREEEADRAY